MPRTQQYGVLGDENVWRYSRSSTAEPDSQGHQITINVRIAAALVFETQPQRVITRAISCRLTAA